MSRKQHIGGWSAEGVYFAISLTILAIVGFVHWINSDEEEKLELHSYDSSRLCPVSVERDSFDPIDPDKMLGYRVEDVMNCYGRYYGLDNFYFSYYSDYYDVNTKIEAYESWIISDKVIIDYERDYYEKGYRFIVVDEGSKLVKKRGVTVK